MATRPCTEGACQFQAEDVWSCANVHGLHHPAARLRVCCPSLQPISSASTRDVTSSSMLVRAATNPLHSISLGHKFILQTNCSFPVASSVFLISLLFTLLIQHHLPWPSKLWKADRRPRRVLDRSAKSDSDFDSPFWDCQSVACNVPWHVPPSPVLP